jgi:hypothetical protein
MLFGASASFLPDFFKRKNLKLGCTNAIILLFRNTVSAAQYYTAAV